jgi:hypothetical protein
MAVKKRKRAILRWSLLLLLFCGVALYAGLLLSGRMHSAVANPPVITAPTAEAATPASQAITPASTPQKTGKLQALMANAAHAVLPVPPQSFDCSKANNPEGCLQQQQAAAKEAVQTTPTAPAATPASAAVKAPSTTPTKTSTAPKASPPAAAPKEAKAAPATSIAQALNAKQKAMASTTPDTSISSSPNTATTRQASAEKACQMTPNPDKCLRKLTSQQGTPVSFSPANYPLTSDMLGLSGPVSFMLRYDADLALILGVDYAQMFNESFGVSGKFTLGAKERRANVTAGFGLSSNQQVKFTYEYLAQNLNLDFASGAVQEWVDQHALGGAYQYLIRHEILHSFEISGYAVRANSQDLSSMAFNQVGDTYDVNHRRIAGGTENTLEAALNLLPLKNTSLTVGAGYSSLSYDTQYEASPSNSGLAYRAELTHILTPKVKISGGVNSNASGREHNVGVSHILPHDVEVSLKGQYVAGTTGLPDSKNVAVAFTYPAPKQYTLGGFANNMQELRNWIEKPVVYKTRVLAIKDEMIKSYSLVASDLGEQTIYLELPDRTINPVSTVGNFTFNDPELSVTFAATIVCPSTDPSCSLNSLHLQLDTSVPNQATLVSTANVDASNPATNPGSPYVITITGTGTRSGLAQPVVASADFRLSVVAGDAPQWVTTSGTLKFDATPTIQGATTGNATTDGIQLLLSGTQPGDVITFGLNPAQPPALPNWKVVSDNNSPANWYLMRDVDGSGNLNASDIGGTPNVSLCAYVNNSQCIAGTVAVKVNPDTTLRAGNSVIGGNVPTLFTTTSGSSAFSWDTVVNGLKSFYVMPDASTIPIIGDVFSNWETANIGGWVPPATISINSSGVMTGVAPIVSVATNYNGTFEMDTKSAGGTTATVLSTFNAAVTAAAAPTVQSIVGTIRFDLTNGGQDPGLTPQPGDYSGGRTLIDLTTMVTNIGNGSNQVPLNKLVFTFNNGSTQQGNWQILTYSGPGSTAGHTYLFRNTVNSNLQAGDISNTPTNIPICIANSDSPATPNCNQHAAATVTSDTLTRSGGQQYVRVQIPDFVASVPSFEINSGENVPAGWNLKPISQSVFLGQNLLPGTALLIDNDALTVFGSLVKDAAWTTAYSIVDSTNGTLAGQAPTVAAETAYTSTFTTTSKAAGASVSGVGFITAVLPASSVIPNFEPTASTIRFDMINSNADAGLKPATAADVIDVSAMVTNLNTIGVANVQFCFNNDPTGATCTTSSGNWKVHRANSTDVSTWGATLDHVYLLRNVNGSGNLEAGDITRTIPSEVTLYAQNTSSGPNYPTDPGTVEVTVTGDGTNNILGNISTLYTANSGDSTFQWDTTDHILMSYYGVSVTPLFTIDNDAIPPVTDSVTKPTSPAWTTALSIDASGVMTGTAPTVSSDTTFTGGKFLVTSKSALARNVNVSFTAKILPAPLFTSCTSESNNCAMKFDTIDVTKDPGSNDAIPLTGPSGLLNSSYQYSIPQFTVTGSAATDWVAVKSGADNNWYLIRNNPNSPSIDASQVGLPANIPITVKETDSSAPPQQNTGTLVVKVAPDPNLLYLYIGSSPLNLRVINDPDSSASYANDAQPGLPTISFANNVVAYTPARSNYANNVCSTQTIANQPVGCQVINDSNQTLGYSGTPPTYAPISGSVITFTYGNLTQSDNWKKPLADFAPQASSNANGNTAVALTAAPLLTAYDLEVVPRKMITPVSYSSSEYNCPDPMPDNTNECLIPVGNPNGSWSPETILNINVGTATQSQLKLVQYKPVYPNTTDARAYFCRGKITNTQSRNTPPASSWQSNCFTTGMPSNGISNTVNPSQIPQAPVNQYIAFAADYSKSGGSNIASVYADYLNQVANPHTTNIVLRYAP